MKKSPVPIAAIRDAVRRKSVGLSFTTNFSIFNRTASGSGADEDAEQVANGGGENGSAAGSAANGGGEPGDADFDEDQELQPPSYRNRQDSAPRENDDTPSPAMSIRNNRTSYVEPPEPPLPPPGGLLEAATKNVQGKMREMMETFHEVTQSHVSEPVFLHYCMDSWVQKGRAAGARTRFLSFACANIEERHTHTCITHVS